MLASVQQNQLEPWRRAWRDIEIVADKVDPSILEPLTFSKFELQKLSELGGSASFIARGFAASRETLTTSICRSIPCCILRLTEFSIPRIPKSPVSFFQCLTIQAGRRMVS